MKFRKEFSRLTMKEAPLDPGQYACKFIEDPNGSLQSLRMNSSTVQNRMTIQLY